MGVAVRVRPRVGLCAVAGFHHHILGQNAVSYTHLDVYKRQPQQGHRTWLAEHQLREDRFLGLRFQRVHQPLSLMHIFPGCPAYRGKPLPPAARAWSLA